jgi:3-oxoadipate enol-lactonase
MPHATTADGVRLYYEEAGSGTPIIFVHEFAADYLSWEPQVRYFARRHRCVTYSARGYAPSDVPASVEAYTYEHFARDVIAVLDHLAIPKAHVVGLSMGGYSTLQVGLRHPDRALSLTLAGTGSGSERWFTEEFRRGCGETAAQLDKVGAEVLKTYGLGPTRIPFLVKDPRGYQEFTDALARHDLKGSAQTLRGFQAGRPSIYDFEADIRRIALPTLIVCGDEDDPCIEPSLLLKKWIATSGLAIFPKTGHTTNLEEPALFNETLERFFALVDAGRWGVRDPRSMRASG